MTLRKKLKIYKALWILLMVGILGVLAALYFLFSYKRAGIYNYGSIIILAGVYAFIIYKTKFVHRMKDKDYDGTIESITARLDIKIVGRMIMRIPVYDVTVKDDNGEIHVYTYKQVNTSPQYYAPTSRVHHYAGAKYLIKYNHKEYECICPLCGKNTRNDNLYYCAFCNVQLEKI